MKYEIIPYHKLLCPLFIAVENSTPFVGQVRQGGDIGTGDSSVIIYFFELVRYISFNTPCL